MGRFVILLIVALLQSGFAAAETRWIHMRSENFEMYSAASESATRQMLGNFERVRGFFVSVLKTNPGKDQPVTIIGFNSEKEYAPYRPNDVAFAYYHPGADRDYIVMSKVGYDLFPVAVHEYVHLVARHAGYKFPPWLNEGLAELYSTLKPQAGGILVGDPPLGRLVAARTEKWIPLAAMVSADQTSPYYNEKNRAGGFYGQSWALVHMLALNDDYSAKFSEMLNAATDGGDSIAILEKVYGKPLAAIEKDLRGYLQYGRFRPSFFDLKLAGSLDKLPAEPAPAVDLQLALADINNRAGKEQETQTALEKLAREYPDRPEAFAGLGYLAWSRGNLAEAEANFGKAFDAGHRLGRFLWDYGRLVERTDPDRARVVLSRLADSAPDRLDVQLELASVDLSAHRPAQSLARLLLIKKVRPDDAPRLFMLLAYSQLQLGQIDPAKSSVSQLAKWAKSDADKDALSRLQTYLDRATAVVAVPRFTPVRPAAEEQSETSEPTGQQPPAVRRVQLIDRSTVTEYAPPPTISGQFSELICGGEHASIVLTAAGARKIFLIEDPSLITVVGRDGGKVDLTCGRQPPSNIRIEYGLATQAGIDGLVKVLYFEK